MKRKRLGEVLCERGQLSPSDLQKALQDQQALSKELEPVRIRKRRRTKGVVKAKQKRSR